MLQLFTKIVSTATAAIAGAVLFSLPVSSVAAPAVSQVRAKYMVNGSITGSGTVVEYDGQVYVPLGAVKALTGTQVNWDAQTATLSTGAPSSKGGKYIEDLPGEPYYTSSGALCWQVSADATVGKMHNLLSSPVGSPCNLGLPKRPTVGGKSYAHSLAVLVSADGNKASDPHNTVTLDYDLNGRYTTFSGSAGLVDKPFNTTPMKLEIVGDGRTLGTAVIAPASLPASFKVDVAHVRQLSVQVSNVSGAAPRWHYDGIGVSNYQYAPGALVIANPLLAS